MTPRARQGWLLGALLATFGVVVAYQLSPEDTATDARPASDTRKAPARRQAAGMDVAAVQLERLQPGPGTFTAPTRDPFRYRPKPAPPPPPPPPMTTFVPPPPMTPPPPPPRPITLKYLGFAMGSSGGRLAWLQDTSGRPPMSGRQGDVIDGQYRLLRVDPEEIEIAWLDGTGRRRIPKTGQ
jgi:hypothetical protein